MTELPKHPAVYSKPVLDMATRLIQSFFPGVKLILDVFAGVGKLGDLGKRGIAAQLIGIELQPKWAVQGKPKGCLMIVGNSLYIPFRTGCIPLIFSSPVYGNRISDHHNVGANDTSDRITYKHKYGEDLHPDNSGQMYFWQQCYKDLHISVIAEMFRVLEEGGLVIWNTKDFYQTKYPKGNKIFVRHNVTEWFIEAFLAADFEFSDRICVPAQGMKKGANRETRCLTKTSAFSGNREGEDTAEEGEEREG